MANGLIRNILTILSGNGLAQLIQFVGLFFIAKLYEPADFSSLAIAQSIGTIVTIFLTMQLHLVIPLNENNVEKGKVYNFVFFQIFVFFVLAFFVSCIISYKGVTFGVLIGFVLSLFNLNQSYLSANLEFKRASYAYVVRALLIISFQIAFSYMDFEYKLIWSFLLAELLLQVFFLKNYECLSLNFNENKASLIKIYKERRSFWFYGVISEFLSVFAFFLPLYIIELKYGDQASGNYGMISRLIWAPTVLVSSSICQVVYSRYAPKNKKEVYAFLDKISVVGIFSFILLVSIFSFYSMPLFKFILGENWSIAVEIAPWLIIWATIYLSCSVFRMSYRIFEIQHVLVVFCLLNILMLSLLYFLKDITMVSFMKIIVFLVVIDNMMIYAFLFCKRKKIVAG